VFGGAARRIRCAFQGASGHAIHCCGRRPRQTISAHEILFEEEEHVRIFGLKVAHIPRCCRALFLAVILCFPVVWSQTMEPSASDHRKSEPSTVDSVDLKKYAGLWYEIARMPNRFQKQCACNTTATYSIRDDGRIDVLNRCTKSDGTIDEAEWIARIVDTVKNSKLEVSFVRLLGIRLFWGDYWIIGLEKDYRYAVVGTPSRKYGWILSRTPSLVQADKSRVFEILKQQGYDPGSFIFTEQK
jgi:apolipoprotein D and lipocalin family protein